MIVIYKIHLFIGVRYIPQKVIWCNEIQDTYVLDWYTFYVSAF